MVDQKDRQRGGGREVRSRESRKIGKERGEERRKERGKIISV